MNILFKNLQQLILSLEAYILNDGWLADEEFLVVQEETVPKEEKSIMVDDYSFLDNLGAKDAKVHFIDKEKFLGRPQNEISNNTVCLISQISNWQELEQYVEHLGYHSLDRVNHKIQLMIVLSYEGGKYVQAKDYVMKWLSAIKLNIDYTYCSTVLKAPRSSYDVLLQPEEQEIIEREIELLKPEYLLVCGRIAYQALFKKNQPLTKSRMQRHVYNDIPTIVTYDPQMVLIFSGLRSDVWLDIQRLQCYMQKRPL